MQLLGNQIGFICQSHNSTFNNHQTLKSRLKG